MEGGRDALIDASEKGHLEEVKRLVEKGGKKWLLGKDGDGFTVLYIASHHGHFDIVKHLVKKGGRELLMATASGGFTALDIASHHGHLDIVKHLVEKGGRELLMAKNKDDVKPQMLAMVFVLILPLLCIYGRPASKVLLGKDRPARFENCEKHPAANPRKKQQHHAGVDEKAQEEKKSTAPPRKKQQHRAGIDEKAEEEKKSTAPPRKKQQHRAGIDEKAEEEQMQRRAEIDKKVQAMLEAYNTAAAAAGNVATAVDDGSDDKDDEDGDGDGAYGAARGCNRKNAGRKKKTKRKQAVAPDNSDKASAERGGDIPAPAAEVEQNDCFICLGPGVPVHTQPCKHPMYCCVLCIANINSGTAKLSKCPICDESLDPGIKCVLVADATDADDDGDDDDLVEARTLLTLFPGVHT